MKFFDLIQIQGLFATMEWGKLLVLVEDLIQWLTRVRDFLSLKITVYEDAGERATPEEACAKYAGELQALFAAQPDTDNYSTPAE